MEPKTCFLIGHEDTPGSLAPILRQVVERHVAEYGVREFTTGWYGDFDSMAMIAVAGAKVRYPDVEWVTLRPYHPEKRYSKMYRGSDHTLFPLFGRRSHRAEAIVQANRYMVDNSDYLIAYAWRPGATRELVEYARERERQGLIRVENLAVRLNKDAAP